ncbi:type VI secretion system baseplate subunit TssE [Acidiphilium sp. AL]|uniref:Type VI secretion system baseplate subunit TssE n=1 Tax=Acidiphilium iwatense TaxID=768198 RepID=A0ABS9DXZ4_9PROT|nr:MULTISPECIES: type VI secretion system baseplate subunit TssE [Acidiphilium]MCF3947612.1 type VI secretion system baseplate subunit TssE [Acidiphilium iwatense]MCU4160778.1 type VI secretion system baseplate subunit TssE [Acidiphilium sp. AL]
MSGKAAFNDRVRDAGARVQLSPLDRLLDDAPDRDRDRPISPGEALAVLRRAVRRDLEALLNAKRRWRSLPPLLGELQSSIAGYGLPDYTSGSMADPGAREAFRAEVERTIKLFEPRFAQVTVRLVPAENPLDPTLHMRIDGLLHADPAPEPISFDTVVDATSAEIEVKGERFV